MASEKPGIIVNGSPATSSSASPAARLQQEHQERERQAHQATVQDVVDEYDREHAPPSGSNTAASTVGQSQSKQTPGGTPTSTPGPRPSAQKPQGSGSPAFDGRSEEEFPALGGGPKPGAQAATVPAAWSARKPGFGNGSSNASLPTTTSSARPAHPNKAAGTPKMDLPGKHSEQIRFAPSQMLPRNQLKKPVADIVRETSRKSKGARVDLRHGPNGSYIFEGVGSVEAVRQALKEIAQQVGSKVSSLT